MYNCICRNCGAKFRSARKDAKFCSAACKNGWRWRSEEKLKRAAEEEERAKAWADRLTGKTVRCVCKNCFAMWWAPKQEEFCCLECKQYHNAMERMIKSG